MTNLTQSCQINISDILRVSLIHLDHVHTLEVILGSPSRLSFKTKQATTKALTYLKPLLSTSVARWSIQSSPAGSFADTTVVLTIPRVSSKANIFAEQNINRPFAIYIVDANLHVWLLGTLDSPLFLKKADLSLTGENKAVLTFEAALFEHPKLLLAAATPHFLQPPSHAFTPDFYNFD
jgi:hypothetical protein